MTAQGLARKIGPALALLGMFAALLAWQHAGQKGPPVTPLAVEPATSPAASTTTSTATNIEPLRAAFNRDIGKVRLLLLIDPT
jgi:hypothetical protein